MGAVTRNQDIRRRRNRREKRRKAFEKELKSALLRGRTHQDRVRLAKEFREKKRA